MRPLRITAIALIALCTLVLAGCGGDDAPDAGDTTTSATPEDSASATPSTDESSTDEDVADFPEVDGFTYTSLPGSTFKSLNSSLKGTPQVDGVEARLVQVNGEEAGLVMRLAIDPEAASAAGFEEGFLPGFAGGFAGSSATPEYQDINGTKVVMVGSPDEEGTAYAWLQGSVATIVVFKNNDDAETFAQGALG